MRGIVIKGITCLALLVFCGGGWLLWAKAVEKTALGKGEPGFIRLHVLANSDSPEDQRLKLLVRDAVLQYLKPLIGDETDKGKVKDIILKNKANLIKAATETMIRQGAYYPVDMEYGMFSFPLKRYGDLVVPPGEYEAVRILIGDAEGANWWCVLFPPLCFVDETKVARCSEDAKISGGVESVERNLEFRYKILELFQNR